MYSKSVPIRTIPRKNFKNVLYIIHDTDNPTNVIVNSFKYLFLNLDLKLAN